VKAGRFRDPLDASDERDASESPMSAGVSTVRSVLHPGRLIGMEVVGQALALGRAGG
jgi:hypothetical protein